MIHNELFSLCLLCLWDIDRETPYVEFSLRLEGKVDSWSAVGIKAVLQMGYGEAIKCDSEWKKPTYV